MRPLYISQIDSSVTFIIGKAKPWIYGVMIKLLIALIPKSIF